jgi:hypothetical protein
VDGGGTFLVTDNLRVCGHEVLRYRKEACGLHAHPVDTV